MLPDRYIKDYKGQRIWVYGKDYEWWWNIAIIDDSFKFKVKTRDISSPRKYISKEEAIIGAEKFVDGLMADE